MTNQEIAKILSEIADFLQIKQVAFKPYAYQKAGFVLENLEQDINEIYKKGGIKALERIPGVGKNIAQKIRECLETGRLKYYEELKREMPVEIKELTSIEGVGPKMVAELWKHLKIKNLKDLEKVAQKGKIRNLANFGLKTEKNILQGLAFLKKDKGRFLLSEVLLPVKAIYNKLKNLKEVKQISLTGSLRRMKETIGDVDFLVVSRSPSKVMDFFVSLPGIIKVWGKGPTKASVRTGMGFDMDIRIVPEKSYGSALQYFTGSKEHNIALRKIAMSKGLKLSEYGLFKRKKMIAGKSEKRIYNALGLEWIPPELRENQGEIEAAFRSIQEEPNGLPSLIDYKDILGDLHCHSNWTKEKDSIKDLAETALKIGYSYLGISDHTKFLKVANGLSEKEIEKQRKEIDKLNKRFKIKGLRFKILQGAETNILNDGSIDIKEQTLKKLDYAMAGIHSQFKMEKEKITERIIRAMKNPNIDIIVHLTGRKIKEREEYQLDLGKILRVARETKTILEINGFANRLDIKDIIIKQAKELGVKMIIGTDAHEKDQLYFMELGVAQARRGWAEKKDIINTQSLKKLLNSFKR